MTNHTLEKPNDWWQLHLPLITPLKFGQDSCHTSKGRQIPSFTEGERTPETLREPHTPINWEGGLQRASPQWVVKRRLDGGFPAIHSPGVGTHDQPLNSLFPKAKFVLTMLWIKLVLIAYLVKCTIFLFKILNLQLLLLLNLYTLTCGVLHLLLLSTGLDITFCLLIIILDLVGFIYWSPNQMLLLNLFISMLWLRINFPQKSKHSDLMEVVNLPPMTSNLICHNMALLIISFALIHLSKMVLLKENTGI